MIRTILCFLVAIVLVVFAANTRWQTISEDPIIQTDGQGYFAYLPAVFVYSDLTFGFVEEVNEKYYPADKRAEFIYRIEDGVVNKYFAGTAVMQTPFFLGAHVYAKASELQADGYSKPYQVGICLAAICYLALGLWFLMAFLNSIGFQRWPVAFAALTAVFGTNLLYYTLYEPSMSHVYSFCAVAAFLFFSDRVLNREKINALFGAAISFGLIVLIRPTNGIVLLALPVVAGGLFDVLSRFESVLKKNKVVLGVSIALTLLIVFVQPLIYLVQTGKPMVWSYGEEGFNFLRPAVIEVLFSYRKGLFVYCPMLFVGLLGLFAGLKKQRERYTWLLVFLAVVTWIISSWWMWYYGGSFGHRAFIEYIPFFAIGLAFMAQYGWGIFKPAFVWILGFLLIGLQLVQTYQYHLQIIPYDNMTQTKYWNMFLRTGEDLRWYYSSNPESEMYVAIDSTVFEHDMEQQLGWGNEKLISTENSSSEEKSVRMSGTDEYGITLWKSANEIAHPVNTVRVSGWVKSNLSGTDLGFVCSVEDTTGSNKYWSKRPLRPQFCRRNNWTYVTALFKLGQPCGDSDKISVYPMKSDDATVFIDDVEVSMINAR